MQTFSILLDAHSFNESDDGGNGLPTSLGPSVGVWSDFCGFDQ